MSDVVTAWSKLKAPSLEEMEVLAHAIFERMPPEFRSLCEGLVIRVDDFATDEVLESMEKFAMRACRWQNDTNVDFKMAFRHATSKKA